MEAHTLQAPFFHTDGNSCSSPFVRVGYAAGCCHASQGSGGGTLFPPQPPFTMTAIVSPHHAAMGYPDTATASSLTCCPMVKPVPMRGRMGSLQGHAVPPQPTLVFPTIHGPQQGGGCQPNPLYCGQQSIVDETTTAAAVTASLLQQLLALHAPMCGGNDGGGVPPTPLSEKRSSLPSAPTAAAVTTAAANAPVPTDLLSSHLCEIAKPAPRSRGRHHHDAVQQATGHKGNGARYDPAATYEGYVKRYNPTRGFGFITATHQVLPSEAAPAAGHTTLNSDSSSGSSSANPSDHRHRLDDDKGCCGSTAAGGETESGGSDTGDGSPVSGGAEHTPFHRSGGVRIPVQLGDIFIHQSYVRMQGFRSLPVGGCVRFRVGLLTGQQSFQAVEVELLPKASPPCLPRSRRAKGEHPQKKTGQPQPHEDPFGMFNFLESCYAVDDGKTASEADGDDEERDSPMIEYVSGVLHRLEESRSDCVE